MTKQSNRKHKSLSEKIKKRREKEKEAEKRRKSKSHRKDKKKKPRSRSSGHLNRRIKEFLDIYSDPVEDFISIFNTLDQGGKVTDILHCLRVSDRCG